MSAPPLRQRMPGVYRAVYVVCCLLIAGSLAFIGWRLYKLREGRGVRVVPHDVVVDLLSRPLAVDEHRTLRLGDSRADYLVVFLFTPADCAACLPELSDLSRLGSERKDLDVVAVMGLSNPAEAIQTKESFGLEIPIVQDSYGEIIEAIAPPRTPWKLVIRRADQRVLFESPPNVGYEERQAFLERVRHLGKG